MQVSRKILPRLLGLFSPTLTTLLSFGLKLYTQKTKEKGYVNQWVGLMVMGETNVKIPNSSATRSYVDEKEGFNLTFVDAYIQHDENTGSMILEVYEA